MTLKTNSKEYVVDAKYNTYEEVQRNLASRPDVLIKFRKHVLKNGSSKQYYKCAVTKKCPVTFYVETDVKESSYVIYREKQEHFGHEEADARKQSKQDRKRKMRDVLLEQNNQFNESVSIINETKKIDTENQKGSIQSLLNSAGMNEPPCISPDLSTAMRMFMDIAKTISEQHELAISHSRLAYNMATRTWNKSTTKPDDPIYPLFNHHGMLPSESTPPIWFPQTRHFFFADDPDSLLHEGANRILDFYELGKIRGSGRKHLEEKKYALAQFLGLKLD